MIPFCKLCGVLLVLIAGCNDYAGSSGKADSAITVNAKQEEIKVQKIDSNGKKLDTSGKPQEIKIYAPPVDKKEKVTVGDGDRDESEP